MLTVNGSNAGDHVWIEQTGVCASGGQVSPRVTIDNLPNEVLFEIIKFYLAYPVRAPSHKEDAWHTLVHVCQRWRRVVFGSPRRLDLRLLCVNRRLVKTLDIWPELPIAIHIDDEVSCQPSELNVISMLKGHDRVCKIFINGISNQLLDELATSLAASEPFSALVELELVSCEEGPATLPDSFLGGSVPRLRLLKLWGVPCPAIGKLLLSTCDLDTLTLGSIPPSGCISPESMLAILSTLTRLRSLHLHFQIPEFWTHEASQHRPALRVTPVVLPALTNFDFYGDSKYLEDVVSRIDAPLHHISLAFSNQLAVSDIPPIRYFIGRTKIPNASHEANIYFSLSNAILILFQEQTGDVDLIKLQISYSTFDSHQLSPAEACSLFLPPLPTLERLAIYHFDLLPSQWLHEVDSTTWVELLRPFIAVKDLVVDEPFVLSLAWALQELVGERVAEILPALQNIFLKDFQPSGPVPEGIAKFIAAREPSGYSIIVHRL